MINMDLFIFNNIIWNCLLYFITHFYYNFITFTRFGKIFLKTALQQ